MPHPVEEDVKAILRPYHHRIRTVVEGAWTEWRLMAGFRADQHLDPLLYSRTVANYVFDAIARLAIAEFARDESITLKIDAQTVKFFFGGSVCGRFKKGDNNKLGRNILTQAVLNFTDADGMIPGFPSQTAKVEFIWIANDIQTKLEHVLVVARDGDRLIWDYEIEKESKAVVIPFPATVNQTGQDDVIDLVQPKARPIKKSENE